MKEDLCRICLTKEGALSSIFVKTDKVMISTKIMCLAKVRIYPGDGLPDLICSKCLLKLKNCIEFINLCEVTDLRLRATVFRDNNEPGVSETESYDNDSNNENQYSLQNDCTNNLEVNLVCDVNNFVKKESDYDSNDNISIQKGKKSYNKKKKIKQQCNICGRVMSSKHRLKTHLVTHTEERPFSCPFCKKNFSLETNLKVHIRVHTGEKPLQCSVCGMSFAQSSGLIAHKRKHTGQLPYKCPLCPRSFRTIGHMQYHTKRHTGEVNFECDKCGRAFITRGELNQHTATHSGSRPHVCSVCGLRLTRASNLKRHMQRLHGSPNSEENTKLERTPA